MLWKNHAIMKSASLITHPKFHRKKEKKTSCSTFQVAQNDSKKTKIKNIQVWKHHTSTSNSSPSKVSGLPFFIPKKKKKKKTWIWQRRPRPPELRQSTSATNLDPRGNKKHQKVGFEEQHFWMIWMNWMLKGKRLEFLGWFVFLGWFFVVKDAFWKLLVWEIWILLDDFFLKRLDFSGRQASMGGCGKLVTPDLWHFCCPLIGWSWVWSDMTSMLQSRPKKLSILRSQYFSFCFPVFCFFWRKSKSMLNSCQANYMLSLKHLLKNTVGIATTESCILVCWVYCLLSLQNALRFHQTAWPRSMFCFNKHPIIWVFP